MKRLFLSVFISVIFIGTSATAQSSAVRADFENGLKKAGQGDFAKALTDFRKALSEGENARVEFRARVHFNIGVCFYRLKENGAAVKEFSRAILFQPNYEKAFYALGMAFAELRDWPSAESAFRNALRLNKTNGETWFDLAYIYLARENFNDAAESFQKSIRFKTGSQPISHNNLGVLLARRGELRAAVREFETALEKSNGELIEARQNLQFCKNAGLYPATALKLVAGNFTGE